MQIFIMNNYSMIPGQTLRKPDIFSAMHGLAMYCSLALGLANVELSISHLGFSGYHVLDLVGYYCNRFNDLAKVYRIFKTKNIEASSDF